MNLYENYISNFFPYRLLYIYKTPQNKLKKTPKPTTTNKTKQPKTTKQTNKPKPTLFFVSSTGNVQLLCNETYYSPKVNTTRRTCYFYI